LNQEEIPHSSKIQNKQCHLFIKGTKDLDELQILSCLIGFMIKTRYNNSLVEYQLLL